MALNVTTAVFAENCNTATASPSLAQWDTEQVLQISGIDLPDSYKVEFSTVYTRNAIPEIGDASGVTIPNVLLQRSAPITAYVVLYGENGGRNREYWITIYITPGQPPETITPDPEQADVIDQAIAALNSGVGRAEAAAEAVQNLSVAAETLATGEPATVEKTVDEETGAVKLNFGLPRGAKGDPLTYEELTPEQKAELVQGPILEAQNAAVTAVRNARTSAVDAVGSAGTTQVNAVNQAGTTQTGAVNQAGANQVAAVNQAGATQVQAVEDKGNEVLDSIPQDYSDLADDVADLSRQLNDETTGLDSKAPVILETVSGAIASFSDGADSMPIKKLVAQIEPVQDLHGQESPYPAGGGKNLVNIADSTTPITAQTTISDNLTLPAGTYILSADVNNTGAGGFRVNLRTVSGSVNMGIDGVTSSEGWVRKSSQVITIPEDGEVYLYCNGSVSGYSGNYKNIMLCKSTATDPTVFAPYENICPISGHTGAEIEQTGVNVWDEEYEQGTIDNTTGELVSDTILWRSKNVIPVKGGETYYFVRVSDYNTLVFWYASDMTYLGYVDNTGNVARTAPANAAYARLRFFSNVTNPVKGQFSVNHPATDTEYHPYTGNQISVNWETEAGTVYGGYFTLNNDNSVDLTALDELITLDGISNKLVGKSEETTHGAALYFNNLGERARFRNNSGPFSNMLQFTLNSYTNMPLYSFPGSSGASTTCHIILPSGTTVEEGNAWLQSMVTAGTPVQVRRKLVTPQNWHFDNIGQLQTFLGTNNIWASTGDTSVEYCADTKLYIDGITAPDEDMIANSNIAIGKYFVVNNQLYLSTAAIAAGASIVPGTNCTATNLAEALNALNS